MTRLQVAIGIMFMLLTGSGFACKYNPVSLKESVSQAQSAFVARAETASNGRNGKGPEIPASMRVTQVLKGSAKMGQIVSVHTSNSSCGLGIQIGQRWLILANGESFRSDQPSGSILLTDQAARRLVFNELGVNIPN